MLRTGLLARALAIPLMLAAIVMLEAQSRPSRAADEEPPSLLNLSQSDADTSLGEHRVALPGGYP